MELLLLLLLPPLVVGVELSGVDGLEGILVEVLLEVALAVAVALLAVPWPDPLALLEDAALPVLLEPDVLDEAAE
ncbi:hypothetical protein [Leptothoe spongobia]|uniref:Uncharacterized protein n=1 Tax=Leptothoe spongobia TAU-MAC 1115 TaxID=1967444 RepID=A0A947GGN6_9CYAN|nr:hypothetical protein [Leptothoe spongobia]MBT9314454.1 hypothetical protein [Leptothoe spongobia TAU-MAC 1115]